MLCTYLTPKPKKLSQNKYEMKLEIRIIGTQILAFVKERLANVIANALPLNKKLLARKIIK